MVVFYLPQLWIGKVKQMIYEEPGVTENWHKITKITKDNEIFYLSKTQWI